MDSTAIEVGAKVTVVDCGKNDTLLHFKKYHVTDMVRNRLLSFESGEDYLTENITSGSVTFSCYRDDVIFWILHNF